MGTLLNVAQEDTGSSLLILRIMVKIVKRASYLVHPIEMRHGELADVIGFCPRLNECVYICVNLELEYIKSNCFTKSY